MKNKCKRQDNEDMEKIQSISNEIINNIFVNVSDLELFKEEKSNYINIDELTNSFRCEITKKILSGEIPKDESSIIEELIDEKVAHFRERTLSNFRLKKMNNALSNMRGVYTKLNTILYYLLLGKYPDIFPEYKRLKDKNDKLRKENFELKQRFQNNSPSQQTSVDRREIVHTKEISDVGENPTLETLNSIIENEK